MSEFMMGDGRPLFNDSMPPEISLELGIYVDELSEARKRALDVTPTYRDRIGMPDIVEMPDLVAEYTDAIYKIDRYDSTVITREQIANLVFINRQSTEMLIPDTINPGTQYGSMITSTTWASKDIENIGQDLEYIEGVREVVQEISPRKAIQINMMRFAARVWIDRFSEGKQEAAKFGAAVIFGNLFEQNYSDITSLTVHAIDPEQAYLSKQEGFESMSNYCFAGVPMSRQEARDYAVMSRNLF